MACFSHSETAPAHAANERISPNYLILLFKPKFAYVNKLKG